VAHSCSSCALVALFVIASAADLPAAEPAPQPRALYPRFIVELLPRVGGQGIFAIRPAEIARHAEPADVERASGLVFGMFSQLLGGDQSDGIAWPTFADLEQCVCSLELRIIAPPSDDERASFILGAKSPGLLRTIRPFDWGGILRRSLPQAVAARRAGRSYLRVPHIFQLPLPFIGRVGEPAAVYIADDRTLVIGAESDIHGLLDRLAAGVVIAEPLSGWSEVDRDLIALAFDNREVPLVSGRFPAGYMAAREVEALAGSLQTLAVGLSTSDRTRVRFTAVAKGEAQARTAAGALHDLFRLMLEFSGDNKDRDILDLFGMDLLKSAAIDRHGPKVTGTLTADGNVVQMLFALLRGPI
jgi:hypothetical protein